MKDQVLEVRNVDGRLRIASRGAKPAEWEPPDRALRPVCSGPGVSAYAGDEAIDG